MSSITEQTFVISKTYMYISNTSAKTLGKKFEKWFVPYDTHICSNSLNFPKVNQEGSQFE